MKDENKRLVVYLSYLDASKSRSKGRRVPRELAIRKPSLDDVVEAANKLKLDPKVEDKSYPKNWFEEKKRITILKKKPKQILLRDLCMEIRKKKRR